MKALNARVSLSILALAAALSMPAAEWRVDTVDKAGAGMFSSMKADTAGNLHVAYIPAIDGHPLMYAFWDHKLQKWFTMKVSNVASFCTLALDSKQHPHISYADHGTGLGAKLRHAWWDGNKWQVIPITVQSGAVVAYYTSIALDKNDKPMFSFYDYADPGNNFRLRMRAVMWMGDYFEADTVDAQGGSGKYNSLAIDSQGTAHLAYANVKYESSSLRYATWNGAEWKTQYLEGAPGSPTVTASVALILDSKDTPHITYSLLEKKEVKYATRVDGKWRTEPVAPLRKEAYPDRNGIALDPDGNPYISYYDAGTGALALCHRKDGKWYGEVLEQDFAGANSSLVIDHGMIYISYADEMNHLFKVASRPLDAPPGPPVPQPNTAAVVKTK
jgi:hypothetical protein